MGTTAKKLLEESGINVKELIMMLQKAYADEWLAYYQYWIGAKVAAGIPRETVVTEMTQHAADEFRHAGLVADRILQLGAKPLLEPKEWLSYTYCGYDRPDNPDVRVLLAQNIKAEQCAIKVYKSIMDYTKDKDPVTYNMALGILEDEVEHEEDLETIQNDIRVMEAKLKFQ
jgi:bacterioferritin